MHGPINVKSPNNISEWQMRFNSEFKGLMKVKLCTALLRMLVVRIRSFLKSVLRYKFLILDTYNPDIIFTRARM
jgi:hypothetical protein